MFGWLKKYNREKIKAKGLSPHEIGRLHELTPLCNRIPESLQPHLYQSTAVIMNEKNFEGCGSLQITGDIKLTVAAHASLLLLGGASDYYPDLFSILIYPSAYIAPVQDMQEDGVIVEGRELREGESWGQGSLVLAWDEVTSDARKPDRGKNLVIHEFAHEIDQEFGLTDPFTIKNHKEWGRILQEDYQTHIRNVEDGRPTVLDEYGATDLHEFFAVATEAFLGTPLALQSAHPDLYYQLTNIYRIDPASW